MTVVVKGCSAAPAARAWSRAATTRCSTAPDSLEAHLLDTLAGGGWINDQELVWTLVTEAPRRVLELESRYGCLFDRTPAGRIHQKPFAGQSHDRTIHKGDLTGIEIMNRLTEQVWERPDITALEECRAVELLLDGAGRPPAPAARHADAGVRGAPGPAPRSWRGRRPHDVPDLRVLGRQVDRRHRAGVPRGRAAARHGDGAVPPTGLVVPGSLMTGALLEEGLSGAGGHLRNGRASGSWRATMPPHGALHARTRRARIVPGGRRRARHAERRGAGSTSPHLGAEVVERNFVAWSSAAAIRPRPGRGPVEVGPTAHFLMGGVVIDPACRTPSRGCSRRARTHGGVHGANRLGGNGVAESTVFGGLAGDTIAAFVEGRPARAGGGPARDRGRADRRRSTGRPAPPSTSC